MERFGITVGGQLLEAVRFAGVGVLLGLWYDVFRLLRLLTRPNARRIFLHDLLFFASAAAVTLLCSLPISSGHIRLFHLLSVAVGFVAYYQTVGRLVYAVARLLVRLLEWFGRLLHGAWVKITETVAHLWAKRPKAAVIWHKKMQKNFKNRLKLSRKV